MYPPTINETRSVNDLFNGAYVMFFFFFFFHDFLFKSICCGYSFELHQQVDAIQMGTTTYVYKVDKKYTGCNLKTTELLDCALIGVCAVISLNTVGCIALDKRGNLMKCFSIKTCVVSLVLQYSSEYHNIYFS